MDASVRAHVHREAFGEGAHLVKVVATANPLLPLFSLLCIELVIYSHGSKGPED